MQTRKRPGPWGYACEFSSNFRQGGTPDEQACDTPATPASPGLPQNLSWGFSSDGAMLSHSRRRWPSIVPSLAEYRFWISAWDTGYLAVLPPGSTHLYHCIIITITDGVGNTKHLYNICTMLDQPRGRWADVVQMLCVCRARRPMYNVFFHGAAPDKNPMRGRTRYEGPLYIKLGLLPPSFPTHRQ